jgi:hypothetical protein
MESSIFCCTSAALSIGSVDEVGAVSGSVVVFDDQNIVIEIIDSFSQGRLGNGRWCCSN